MYSQLQCPCPYPLNVFHKNLVDAVFLVFTYYRQQVLSSARSEILITESSFCSLLTLSLTLKPKHR